MFMAEETLFLGWMPLGKRQGAFTVTGGADTFNLASAPAAFESSVARLVPLVTGDDLPAPFPGSRCQNGEQHQERYQNKSITFTKLHVQHAPIKSFFLR